MLHSFVIFFMKVCLKHPGLWPVFARFVSLPFIAEEIINKALQTEHHTISDGNGDVYMARFWYWNRYNDEQGNYIEGVNDMYPTVRVNFIRRPDRDRHHHDHPWDARTIILKGWYRELRQLRDYLGKAFSTERNIRKVGDTATLMFNEYHRIDMVGDEGCWTMFITWKYQGGWGFDVDGTKIPSKQYISENGEI